jgi:ribosomal protein S4
MVSFKKSRFRLTKRYLRFSNFELYFRKKKVTKIRLGYKFYQKIFRRYRPKKTLKINVRKPRIAIKRKTPFGKALEMKNKWCYLLGGMHKSKIARFVRLNQSKSRSHLSALADAIESRLDVLTAKTSLLPSCWIVKQFIKKGYVYVDNRCVRRVHFKVPLNARVSFAIPPAYLAWFMRYYRRKAKLRLLFWRVIPGFEFNRATLTLIKYRRVPPRAVAYPFDFDISYFYRLYPR